MVSLPTRGISRRLTASWATRRTVPAGAAVGRITAHHGDNPLLLAVIEHSGGAGALLLEQRGFQTAPLVTATDGANGLRGERDDPGNPRRTGASSQLQQRQGTQDDAHLLHAAAEQFGEFFLVLRRDIDRERWTTHTPQYAPKQFYIKMAFTRFLGGQRTSPETSHLTGLKFVRDLTVLPDGF